MVKIANSEVIENAERELMDGITAELDWTAIEKVIREKYHLNIEEDVQFKNGELVSMGNRVAYKLDFDVKLAFSILLDREGNFISLGTGESSDGPDQGVDMMGDRGLEGGETKEAKGNDYKAVVMAMSDSEDADESLNEAPDGSV